MSEYDPASARALFNAALAARANAYAPYSRFAVGAAVLTPEGHVFAGANVENASYPTGLCAEAAAIAVMIAAGGRQIVEALIMADSIDPTTPCGACRQRLREFAAPDVIVYSADPAGIRASFKLGDLLPAAFTLAHGSLPATFTLAHGS